MTITADFSGGEKTVTTEPLYQWDTGQKLALSGLPQTASDIQVHFANAAMAQAIVKATAIENSLPTCDIPNEFLQFGSAAKARAWVFYKASSTEGYTVRTVLISVTPRKRPNDYVSPEDPDSKGIVERALELLEGYEDDLASKLSAAAGAVGTENLADESITVEKVADDLAAVINAKEVKSNKKTTLTGNENSDEFYPTTKAVADALSTKAPLSTAYTFDTTTTNVVYNANNPKIIYLNATVAGEAGIVITAKDNGFQYFLGRRGALKIRYFTGGTSYSDWTQVTEHVDNKKNSITSSNRTSADFYPSIKAVVDYLASNYENLSNKLTSADGIDENSTDTEYPTAKAVYNFVEIVTDDIYTDLVTKENLSNKKTTITGYETSNQFYPTTKAVYDYGTTITNNIEDVKAYIGYTDGDILGLHADFENKVFTRLGAAVGKTAGSDFDTDAFPMYKNRRKCNVADDGTINAFYGDAGYTEDGSNGQVMVYQPKFYYKTVPLKLERADTGLGCNIRKANYYITATPRPGFRLHPVFHDSNGNEVEYVLFSAYEGSAYAPSLERIIDENTDTLSYSEGMKLCSVANVKPISGKLTGFGSRNNLEVMANARGAGWHIDTVQAIAANQLLMLIETGRFELQSVIGKGVVSLNRSAITGAAASFGNGTGEASVTYAVIGGTAYSEGGKRSICYRGLENPWGSLCEHVNGINVWGNGSMYGGQVYIAGDFDFSENRHTGNYHAAGFLLPNNIQANLGFNKYISSFGYSSEDFDWLFIPTEGNGNSAAPVGDTFYGSQDLNGNRTVCYGGRSYEVLGCGCAHWNFSQYAGTRNEGFGGRLFYVPTATA